MGCVSSKFARREIEEEKDGGSANHVVFLTSSTYGVLNLDRGPEEARSPFTTISKFRGISSVFSPNRSEPEIINARELMAGLEDDAPQSSPVNNKSRSNHGVLAAAHHDSKDTNKKKQPTMPRKYPADKENVQSPGSEKQRSPLGVRQVLRPSNLMENQGPLSKPGTKKVTVDKNPKESGRFSMSSRRYCNPLFDPELLASFENELSLEEEERKRSPAHLLGSFKEKCPPGGESCVVLYTTTLRGIRKTFDDCNKVRSAIEEYEVRIIERDISMDSGFKEELRELMGPKEAKVPMVFIKGRCIGGVEEVTKLQENGKLELLVTGLPRATSCGNGRGCVGCGGVRFVVCMDCNGSRKILDENKEVAKCGECNENGLILCPICS
ncbi:uncharacterized protein LOC116248358 [Nymphaea colorata]|nr:uncharacterized protein LOC116248358 [Nymphaea colorata]